MTTLVITPPDETLTAFGLGYYTLGSVDAPAETFQVTVDIEPVRGGAEIRIIGEDSGPLLTQTVQQGGRSAALIGQFVLPVPQIVTVDVRTNSPAGIALLYRVTLDGDNGTSVSVSSTAPAAFEVIQAAEGDFTSGLPTTWALDASGDLAFRDGRVITLEGPAAVAQLIQSRLRLHRGDWLFDENLGVPYLDNLGAAVDLSRLRAAMSESILQVDGVDRIVSFDLELDATTRQIIGACQVALTTGAVISVSAPSTEPQIVESLDPTLKSFIAASDTSTTSEQVRVGFVNNEAFDYRTENAVLRADGWDANTLFGLSNSAGTPTVFSLSFWLYQVGTPPNQAYQAANNVHFAIGNPFAGSGSREIALYVLPRNVGANYQMAFGIGTNGTSGDVFVLPTIVMPTVNAWHHYMFVFDGTGASTADRLRVWVDGVESAVTVQFGATIDPNIPQSTLPFTIGGSSATAVAGPQQGAIKNIGVYGTALGEANAVEQYAVGEGIDLRAAAGAGGLSAYWRCSAGLGDSPSRVIDRVGARDLVAIGATAANFTEV
ncbi:MAG: LamG-like jellyroll fold domain-containing protein [Myxococcota bacterium]